MSKEAIELKMGCTIEEYYNILCSQLDNEDITETDYEDDPLRRLSDEEIDFVSAYMDKLDLQKVS